MSRENFSILFPRYPQPLKLRHGLNTQYSISAGVFLICTCVLNVRGGKNCDASVTVWYVGTEVDVN